MTLPDETVWNYGYDYENRLTSVTDNSSYTGAYTYAADGTRIRAQESNHQFPDRWFLYDGVRPTTEGTLSGDTFTARERYIWEGDSYYSPLVYLVYDNAKYYPLFDGLGSTRQLTDEDEDVTDTYSYEAFGNSMGSTGSTVNPYRYVGSLGYYQTGSSLMHLGARYYMPEVGRFTAVDPVLQTNNQYAYMDNGPGSMVDPSGKRPVQPNDPRFGRQPTHGWPPVMPTMECIDISIHNAYAIANKHFPGSRGELNGPEDAYRHCVWACLARKTCGRQAYNSAVIDHENDDAWWARGHWDPVGSPMDLANDEMGRKISCRGGKCEDRCADAYHRGQLYILPAKFWSP